MSSVIEQVESSAKKIAKRETQRFPEAASIGDAVRQGDVYLTLLAEVPKGCKEIINEWPLQLSSGDTQGSRHILDSREGVRYFVRGDATEFDGPVLLLTAERELTHPEHGHWILPPGCIGVSYQRTQDALDRQRRVLD